MTARPMFPLLVLGTMLAGTAVMAAPDVTPVPSVDLERYVGTWHEIARYPNRFQKNCARDTTAEYALRPSGELTVTNRCTKADGSPIEAVGIAKPRPGSAPGAATFKVRFAPAWLSFIPQVWGDYWILDLPGDYRYAVIGEPSRNYLWVLSRTAQLPDEDYDAAVSAAVRNGYDPTRLVRTTQSARR